MTDLKNKNILYLCSWYPTRVHPTNGNFIQKHARCLVNDANLKALTVVEDLDMSKSLELEKGSIDEVPHIIVYYRPPHKYLKPIFKLVAYQIGFNEVYRHWRTIDLIHLHVIVDAGFFLWLRSFFVNIPFIITEHSAIYLERNWYRISRVRSFFIKKISKMGQKILPVSNNLKMNMTKFGIKNDYEIIPNIVNTDLFSLKKERSEKEKIKFIHISSFDRFKNVGGILRCINELSKKRDDFSFTIAGDGNLNDLKKYADELQIEERFINFHGRMIESEVAEMMREHDVFVLFSSSENLPCVLIEAQSCGLPIISTEIGGTAEIVDDKKYGVLVQPKDEVSLLREMDRMIDNFKSYDSTEIRKRAIHKYSQGMVKNQLIKTYQEVLKIK
jgi:glycosyltransferase involved in cell wall biosynthesis